MLLKTIKHILISIILLYNLNVIGQDDQLSDSTYIKSYQDKIIIKANLSTETDAHFLFDRSDNSRLKLTSNNNYKLFLSLDYQFIGFSFGFTPQFFTSNQDDKLKGESSFNDFQFRFFLGNWIQGIRYKKIKGYYVENTQDFLENWEKGKDPYIQFSNLTNTSWGMSTSYVFNPKFSIRNLIYQTEWQTNSAGSFVPTLNYNLNQTSFQYEDTETESNGFNAKLAFSYYYTFVIKRHWFIAPKLSPSLGYRFSKTNSVVNGIQAMERSSYLITYLDGGLQIGYSSNKFIFGGSFDFSSSWIKENKSTLVENDQIYGVIYFGYRFDAPKFIDDSYKWLNKQIGN